MPTHTLHAHIHSVEKKYSGLNIYDDGALARSYNVVSAALANFLPDIPFSKHEEIFRNVLLHRHLSTLEQGSEDLLNACTLEGFADGRLSFLKSGPCIICTFHLGSYRLLNLLLAKHNIPFALVVSENVVETQGKVFADLHQQFSQTDMTLISAEAPGSALKMLKELKKGKNLLIYIDGNVGAGKQTIDNENSCSIPFLNQKIQARKGVGFLAHAAGVPVLPVICYRKSLHDVRLRFFNPVYPNKNEDRDTFAKALVKTLYDLFAPYARTYAEQWEAWLYLPKVAQLVNPFPASTTPCPPPGKVLFNTHRFGLFKTPGKNYIFDKSSFVSYPINDVLYTMLSRATVVPTERNSFEKNTLEDLCTNGVLVSEPAV